MKKRIISIFFVIFFVSVTFSVQSQVSDSIKNRFETVLNSLNSELNECYQSKNYPQGLDVLNSMEKEYFNLPASDQKTLIYLLQNIYYNRTCIYALTDKKEEALDSFDKAVKYGYADYRHVLSDTDLESIRNSERFEKAIRIIRRKGDYIYILQNAGQYYNENPQFTYQDKSAPELVELRNYFNLDSIAGNGDEVNQILSLMTWAHNKIKHDGHYWTQIDLNAMNIYNHSVEENTGVNCRWLSIFLNECYLSMGFKSRYITCMPKDSKDVDCHVINSVYSQSLGKWIWVDPTNNAYVMDENGNLLGISEVRQRLIKGEPLVLNKDANWNNQMKQTKEEYLDRYMAKNLYWMSAVLHNRVGADINADDKIIVALLPQGYNDKVLDSVEYITYNEDYFWENK
ncbi:MAG: TPR end-of-group domain-containing protein [Dysgonomonas sp.]